MDVVLLEADVKNLQICGCCFLLYLVLICDISFSLSLLWTICSKRKEGGDEAAHVLSVDLSIKTELLPLVM